MSIAHNIEAKIKTAINCNYFDLINNSEKHRGHLQSGDSAESHFKLIIASVDFDNLSLVAVHRLINKIIASEFDSGLHALEIKIIRNNKK